MKHYVIGAMALLAASPALAARVTNLDTVPHVVMFEFAGTVREQLVEPNRTVYFPSTDGLVSLKGGNKGQGMVQMSGMLNGVVGSGRTADIPAGPADDFVIWKGGKLTLQRRIKGLSGSN